MLIQFLVLLFSVALVSSFHGALPTSFVLLTDIGKLVLRSFKVKRTVLTGTT